MMCNVQVNLSYFFFLHQALTVKFLLPRSYCDIKDMLVIELEVCPDVERFAQEERECV